MNKIITFSSALLTSMTLDAQSPNIIFILADDLGIGDISAFNTGSKIYTPNIDYLAQNGIAFTDAHSASALSTPSRYSLLTGRYSWRTELKEGVLDGYSPALIAPDRPTMAQMFSENGYNTACIGKWHLGWGWSDPNKPDELKHLPPMQLFDLVKDHSEKNNIIHSERYKKEVKEMTQLIRKYVEDGRSTPGKKVSNDTNNIWKQVKIFMQ